MPLHYPGHNYLGPGTKDFTAKPVDAADVVARKHDIAYLNAKSDKDVRNADAAAIPEFAKTGSIPGLVGAAGLSVKYGVESLTGVLYGNSNKNMPNRDRSRSPIRDSEGTISDIHSAGSEQFMETGFSDFGSIESIPRGEGMSAGGGGTAPGTDGGIRIGAGHNPSSKFIFTKKFQVYTGGFQFTEINLTADKWLRQYAETGTTSDVKHMTTPLACLDPNALPLFCSEVEYQNLPKYSFAKKCRIKVVPLGYRLPFETNSTTANFANSQMIIQGCKAIGINHKFDGVMSGYEVSATDNDLTKPTDLRSTVSYRSTLYGQRQNANSPRTIGCNVGIPRHLNWYYSIFDYGDYSAAESYAYGGSPNLLKAMEIFNVNDMRGIPIIDFTYQYKCAPIKMGIGTNPETYFYQSAGSRKTTFKAWKPHKGLAGKDAANVLIDGTLRDGGFTNVFAPAYTTILEKAAFLIVDPTKGRQSDMTPPLVSFGCMPIQSNPPLAPTPTFAAGVIQWEISTELEVEVLTDSPYPARWGPWQVQFDPILMRGIAGPTSTGMNVNNWKAYNRGRSVFDKDQLPFTDETATNVITSKTPIIFPKDTINLLQDGTVTIEETTEPTDDEILKKNKISISNSDDKAEFISDYRKHLRSFKTKKPKNQAATSYTTTTKARRDIRSQYM